MKTATLVKTHPRRTDSSCVSFGEAAVYALSEPYKYGDDTETCAFMFVSTSCVLGAWETYAFPAEESGNVLSWGELPGSEKGDASHAQVLANMGYEVAA